MTKWMKEHWRPMMAWQYFAVCLFDFMIAPIFFAWFSYKTKTDMSLWTPLTLQGGGMYHMAMGAIVGITSWQKSQERIKAPDPIVPTAPEPRPIKRPIIQQTPDEER